MLGVMCGPVILALNVNRIAMMDVPTRVPIVRRDEVLRNPIPRLVWSLIQCINFTIVEKPAEVPSPRTILNDKFVPERVLRNPVAAAAVKIAAIIRVICKNSRKC